MTRDSKTATSITARPSLIQRFIWGILGLTHVLCSLLFFTNLTRNPYFSQIALLYVLISIVGVLWAIDVWLKGEVSLPRLPFDVPLGFFLVFAFASSVIAWISHPVLRPGILFETTRVWIFTLVNCVMALYLPLLFTKPIGTEPVKISIWTDLLLALAWGGLWLGFHSNKDLSTTSLIWDSYGGILWGLGCLYAVLRTNRGEAAQFFNVIFSIAFLSSIYGIMQYGGKDIIWSSLVVPYGGRPVSSFGNPNFLSSYLMMVCPLGVAFGLRAEGSKRWGYFLVSFVSAVAVLCTLTRSTYVGLCVGFVVMGALLVSINRQLVLKILGLSLIIFVVLVLVFPKTPISNVQSPLLRFTEIFDAMKSGQPYGPWHQRILIWSSAWDMLVQSRLFGKGWGCFELFYPFFQGKYLLTPLLAQFRTHANNAHNILMELWAQLGMLGAGVAIWMFVSMVTGGWKTIKSGSSGMGRFVAAALLGGIVGMAADNFFGNVSIFFATPAFLFWWNVGALNNERQSTDAEMLRKPKPLSPLWGRPLLIVFGVFSMAVGVYYFNRWKQEVYYFEGFRYAKLGDIPKSIKSLEEAFRWFPGEVNSNYEMGNSYARHARTMAERNLPEEASRFEQKAIEGFTAALRANPGYDEIYFNLGVTQSQAGLPQEAIRNLEISIFINPLLREAYGALANIMLQQQDMKGAANVFARGVEAFPKDKDYWNNLGYCYSQLKDHKNSFQAYKQAVQIDPTFKQGWQNLWLSAQSLLEIEPNNIEAKEALLLFKSLPK